MLKRKTVCFPLLFLCLGAAMQAKAVVMLEVSPAITNVSVGESFDVDVIVDPDGALVGAFDVNLAFDPSLLEFMDATIDPAGALGFAFDAQLATPNAVNVAAVSLEFDLTPFQDGGPFSLFSLTFNALDVGTSPLTLSPGAFGIGAFLSDELGFELPVDQVRNGLVQIAAAEVAEPSALGLLLLGLGAMASVAGRSRRAG